MLLLTKAISKKNNSNRVSKNNEPILTLEKYEFSETQKGRKYMW